MGTPPQVSVAFTAEDKGLSAAIQGLNAELKSLATTQNAVKESADGAANSEQKLAFSMQEARGAAALAGEEIGIKLNRHLRGIIAQSETLGPLLQAAFPVVAAIGFAEVIVHAAEKLSEFISDIFIYTEAEKEAYKQAVEGNKQLIDLHTQLAQAATKGAEAQLTGADKIAEKLKALRYDIAHGGNETDNAINRILGVDAWLKLGLADKNRAQIQVWLQQIKNLQDEYGKETLKEQQNIAAARLAAQLGQARDSLAATTAANAAEQAANERDYAHGRITLAAYWAARRDTIEKGRKAEIDVLAASRKAAEQELKIAESRPGAANEPARIAAREKIAHIDAEIIAANAKAQSEQAKNDEDLNKKAEENARIISEAHAQDAALQGQSAEAAARRLDIEQKAYTQALLATGRQRADVEAEVEAWRRRQDAAAAFVESQKRAQAEMAEFQERQRRAPEIAETAGPFSAEARANVAAMRQEIVLLEQELARMRAEAIPGNVEQQKGIADLTAKIEGMQKAVDQIDIGEKLRTDLSGAVAADVSNFFSKGIAGAHSFGDAMRGLAASVLQSVQQIIGQLIQMQIRAMLLKALTGAGGEGGGLPSVGEVPSALPLPSIGGFATGGFVSGPGGPREDRVPAMLSAGEFVMSADSVAALGAANLEAINKGFATSTVTAAHFATGGFVGGGGEGGQISMGIGLDEGLILKHLSSKNAARVILSQLANNSKAAQRALQRTD